MSVRSVMRNNIIYLPGCLLLGGVIFYNLFIALNGAGMPELQGTAIVVEKFFLARTQDHLPNGTIHVEPDRYVLRLRVEDKEDEFNAGKDIYDSVNPHDNIRVTYTRLRLTEGISVTGVIR